MVRLPALLLATCVLATCAVSAAQSPDQAVAGIRAGTVVQAAMTETPDVAIAAQSIDAERADLRAASSAFDPLLFADVTGGRTSTPLALAQRPAPEVGALGQTYQTYQIGVQKRFRSGLTVGPSVQMTRTRAGGAAALVETSAGFEVGYPVIGGGRRNLSLASEVAAGRRVDAARLDLARARDASVAEALSAYWSYAGAVRALDRADRAESRARLLRDEIRHLIQADERPAADLVPVDADLARRQADRLAAEQAVFEARQQLALAMGGTSDDAARIGAPLDPLPEIPDTVGLDERALVRQALDNRPDLQAQDLRIQAADRVLGAYVADVRPSADLVLDLGYVGLAEGGAGVHQYVPVGLGTTRGGRLGLSLRVHRLGSGGTRATAERQRALREQARIRRDDLARRIEAEVTAAVAETRSRAAEARAVEASVRLYERAVANERRRLQLGIGTLFDAQNAEERLASSEAQSVQADVRYARALVRLRLAVGAPSR